MSATTATKLPHGELELLIAIFRDVPTLPGALCVGRSDLFDNFGSHFEASRICARCPCRTACQSWASNRHKYLTGTWAGTFYGSKRNFDDDVTENRRAAT
jgi:WhiB family transcriptional regulator, redox-sensing transcriptional regulator